MRTRAEIEESRKYKGLVGSTEAIIELLFDIRNLLLENVTSGSLESRREAARLDSINEVIEEDTGYGL